MFHMLLLPFYSPCRGRILRQQHLEFSLPAREYSLLATTRVPRDRGFPAFPGVRPPEQHGGAHPRMYQQLPVSLAQLQQSRYDQLISIIVCLCMSCFFLLRIMHFVRWCFIDTVTIIDVYINIGEHLNKVHVTSNNR